MAFGLERIPPQYVAYMLLGLHLFAAAMLGGLAVLSVTSGVLVRAGLQGVMAVGFGALGVIMYRTALNDIDD